MALNEQSNGFSNISQQDLLSFIMDDNLGLKEEDLFNLITGWVKNGYPGRASLLDHVRYQNMNADFKKNSLSFYKRLYLMFSKLNPRNPNEMVLAIGGWTDLNFDACQPMEIGANFGVLTQPWKKIKAIHNHNMAVKRVGYGIGLVNHIMYLFGGLSEGNPRLATRSTFAFDTIKKSWMDKAPMNEMRGFIGGFIASATLMNKIYVFGGYNNAQGKLRQSKFMTQS